MLMTPKEIPSLSRSGNEQTSTSVSGVFSYLDVEKFHSLRERKHLIGIGVVMKLDKRI